MAPPKMPRVMPNMNEFIPKALRPWIYLLFAFCFQMSGTLYGGVIPHFMGATTLMREDAMMILLSGIVGVNLPFPFLFRFKFRFTNKQLLMNASIVIGVCNLLFTLTDFVPLLCIISFIAGFFKMCGTFECMSSIQLWMTHKRDFRIFFPCLYTFVVGNMSLSPFISLQLAYIFQDMYMMNWLIAGVMFLIALYVFTCMHHFRFMKPLPFVSLDVLGMLMWAAVMLEITFLFNYGEYYNWWDGAMFRRVALMLPVTLALAIWRMCNIRHPYIAPGAWQYKRLVPLLAMFVIVEIVNSTPKVMQNAFLTQVAHYGVMQTSHLNLVEYLGCALGMMFVMWWSKALSLQYTRLFTIGAMFFFGYEAMMYSLVQPGLAIEYLYIPVMCRAFGNAIFFTCLTIYLYDLMRMEHFFMSVTMAGMIRNGVVETMGSGVYSFGLRHQIKENIARGVGHDGGQALLVSIKQLFGVSAVLTLIVMLIFLLWNIQPVRTTLRQILPWNVMGRITRKRLEVT